MATVVYRVGDDVSTDVIYPGRYMATVLPTETPQYAFADDAAFNAKLKGQQVPPGSVVVGGRNFGCGSSREYAVLALKKLGVGGIVVGLTVIGFALSGLGDLGGAMGPSQKEAFEVFSQRGEAPPYYPRFNAAVYSLEHSFPFLNLGERDHWAPAVGGSGRTPVLAWSALQWMRDFQVRGVHPLRLNAP